jgi:glycosyltransferase involved in cell wall biosynthesis
MSQGISVIICCYNSAALLPKTLEHIAKQVVVDNLDWEVIVVDNASVDNTADVAKEEWAKHVCKAEFKVITELQPGLLKARIKGFNEARYDYLLYCDDDNWLNENYIETAFNVLDKNPEVGVCGGLGIPRFETGSRPAWFKGHMMESFALGPQAKVPFGAVDEKRYYVYGAGMVIRRTAIEDVYDDAIADSLLLSGRKGNSLLAGDDAELCFYVLLKGYKLWYNEDLTFKHFLQLKRLNKNYVANMYRGFGKTIPYLNLYHANFPFVSNAEKRKLNSWWYQFFMQFNIGARNFVFSVFKKDRRFVSIMHMQSAKQLLLMRGEFRNIKERMHKLIMQVKG